MTLLSTFILRCAVYHSLPMKSHPLQIIVPRRNLASASFSFSFLGSMERATRAYLPMAWRLSEMFPWRCPSVIISLLIASCHMPISCPCHVHVMSVSTKLTHLTWFFGVKFPSHVHRSSRFLQIPPVFQGTRPWLGSTCTRTWQRWTLSLPWQHP